MTDREFNAEERAEISNLPPPESGLTADDVLEARRRPANNNQFFTGFAIAAVTLLAVAGVYTSGLGSGDDGRERGPAGVGSVHLQAAAEGPEGMRPLKPGDHVASDEQVLFKVDADRAGWLHLLEGDAVMGSVVQIDAGSFTPGGDRPQAWRPDHATGSLTYSAWLCPDSTTPTAERCAGDQIALVWERD